MEKQKIYRIFLISAGAAGAFFVFFRWLLPLLLPFVLAFLLALFTRRSALWLSEKTKLKRPYAGVLCILTVYAIILAGTFFLCRTLLRELGGFLRLLPRWTENLAAPLEQLRLRLRELTSRFPDGVGTALTELVDEFFSGGAGLFRSLPGTLLSFITRTVRKLPQAVLLAVTAVVASFLTAASLEDLLLRLKGHLPPLWRQKLAKVYHRGKRAVGGWLKAEVKLGGVTFLLAATGLMVLGAEYPILFGLLVAFVDLLPILGSGAVLIPWAVTLYLQGKVGLGTAFMVLYGIIAVTRATLEPRFLGKQMGISPLLTLMAVYIGCKLAGFWGLLLFPLAVSVGVQVWKMGREEPPAAV